MKTYIEERAVEVARFMIQSNATVKETAKKFGISKSTVHMDDTKWNASKTLILKESKRCKICNGLASLFILRKNR